MMDIPRLVPAAPAAATPLVAADTTFRFIMVLQYLTAHHWTMPPAADTNALCTLGQALEAVLQLARLPVASPGGSGCCTLGLEAALSTEAAETDGYPVLTDAQAEVYPVDAVEDAYTAAFNEGDSKATGTEAAQDDAAADDDLEVEDAEAQKATEAEDYHTEEKPTEDATAAEAEDEGYTDTEDEEASAPGAPPRSWWRHPTEHEFDPEVSDEEEYTPTLADAAPLLPPLLDPLHTEDWAVATTRWRGEEQVLTDAEAAEREDHAEAKLRRLRSLPPEEYSREELAALRLTGAQKAYHYALPAVGYRRRLLEFLSEDYDTGGFPRGASTPTA